MSALPVEGAGYAPLMTTKKRFLQPGQLAISVEPMQITTILGSCIAVCLWDPQRHIGGMNHFMLPYHGPTNSAASSARFGNVAMTQLVEQLRAHGARLPLLKARVFGGACMFQQMRSSAHLGAQNAEVAVEFLSRQGIEVVQIDIGGSRGRKLTFLTYEGTACQSLI